MLLPQTSLSLFTERKKAVFDIHSMYTYYSHIPPIILLDFADR